MDARTTTRKVSQGPLKGYFVGVVRVFDSGRFMYHFSTGIERLTRADALMDAENEVADLRRLNGCA